MKDNTFIDTQKFKDFINISGEEERFVAMLDIMGFKKMVESKSSDEIYDLFCKVDTNKIITENNMGPIWTMVFSDTIIIVTNSIEKADLFAITVASIMYHRLFFDNGYALNGGISMGKVRVDKDKNILFGKPIIDAHILQEKLYYYGIAFSHEMNTFLDNLSLNSVIPGCMHPIIKKQIPIKSENRTNWEEYYHLDIIDLWGVSSIKNLFTPTDPIKSIQQRLDNISINCTTERAMQYLNNTRTVLQL